MPLGRVREILTPRAFTRLPGAGEEVCGLVGVRSRVVTAFDMGTILGLAPSRAVADHRLLLVEHGERTPAFVVDDVMAVVPADLTAAGRAGVPRALDRKLVLGTGQFEGAPFIALDPDRLLDRLLL